MLVVLVLVAGGGVLAGELVPVREAGERQGEYTANTGELLPGSLVGQTFVAGKDALSGVAVMLATYSGRVKDGQVELHLRRSVDDRQDQRVARADVSELGDNQFYRFEFEPVDVSSGQTFFFFVVSSGSVPGGAVTVDIDGRDPYPKGSAYLVRNGKSGGIDAAVLARSGKQTIDMAFETYYTVSLRVAAVNKIVAAGSTFVKTWDEQRGKYIVWAKVGAPAVLLLAMLLSLQSLVKKPRSVLLVLFVLAVAVRLMYAVELPLTNDEGNYLYDARTLLEGKLAGGDGYVKAPLVVAWVTLWQILAGQTILAGRLASVIIGAATLFPLYILGRELGGKRAGLIAAGAWALLGVTTVYNIYVHTQPMALFFGVSGLAVLLATLRGRLQRRQLWLFASGVLLGLGVVSRKSILALGLVPLMLISAESRGWRRRGQDLVVVGLGFLLVVGLFLAGSTAVYGSEGFWEALGANSAEDGITAVDPAEIEQVRAYSIRGMTPFFRESLPLILLAMMGLGIVLESLVTRGLNFLVAYPSPLDKLGAAAHTYSSKISPLVTKTVWIVPLIIFWWAWGFFSEYEGGSVMVFGMRQLWYVMAGVLVLVAVLSRGRVSGKRGRGSAVLVPVLWVGGLVFFYTNWIKFHANYIGEFLPPLVLLAGLAAPVLRQRKVRWLVVPVLLWALFVSGYVTLVFEHTGTFDLKAVREAADWAKASIPAEKSIFTGAAIVPYLSGHHTALNIAHPRWYAYEFTRRDPKRLNTFLPPAEEMTQAFREAEWFLLDQQTSFSFFMEYAEIEAGVERDFAAIKGISNGSNTLTFYRRIKLSSQ